VVNEVLNGEPTMAVYCILVDLGAIYDRQYGDKTLAFALSRYTYYDDKVWDGLGGFVLWNRETESLWWPLIDKAVSGPLKGVELLEKNKANWEDTSWKAIKDNYPNAQVLKSGQDFERPKIWQRYNDVSSIVKNYSLKKNKFFQKIQKLNIIQSKPLILFLFSPFRQYLFREWEKNG
jgi:Protein of unknown function (DUF3179)